MIDEDAIGAFGALAHADRLAAYRLLVRHAPDGLPSGEIAHALDIAPTRMSFHLSTLERAGLVTARRNGRHVFYAVDVAAMRNLIGFLTDDCCGGHPEICAAVPARHSPGKTARR
jgi:ArsR family transcriptional regulator